MFMPQPIYISKKDKVTSWVDDFIYILRNSVVSLKL